MISILSPKLLAEDMAPTEVSELDEDAVQRMLDERGVPSSTDLQTLSQQLEDLMRKMEELETDSSQ